jgi:hypothetical protein
MRIKLDKRLVHIGLEIYMLSKSMPPLGIFVAYWLHLSLSFCCIEDWALCEKSIYIIAILFLVFISLHAYTQKPKNTFIIIFPGKLATTTFNSSWVRQPFLYWKVLQLISSTWESSTWYSRAVWEGAIVSVLIKGSGGFEWIPSNLLICLFSSN